MKLSAPVLAAVCLLAFTAAGGGNASGHFPGRKGGEKVLGTKAPAFGLDTWLNSDPLEPVDLRGRVVLVRWWTDTCPFCSTSAPALRDFDRKYAGRGLSVIGVFHPKPPGDSSLERMRRAVERFGFQFPVALDADWKALDRWWLEPEGPGWTSVSFLLDKKGIIRWVHPGGEYHEGSGGDHWADHTTCNREYHELEDLIRALIAE